VAWNLSGEMPISRHCHFDSDIHFQFLLPGKIQGNDEMRLITLDYSGITVKMTAEFDSK